VRILFFVFMVVSLLPGWVFAQQPGNVRLVVQQNGQALVTEERSLALPKAMGSVTLPDLPTTIDAQTLQVRSKTAPKHLRILDLALDDELLTPATLLRKHLGKKVILVMPDAKTKDGRIQKEATVLSTEEAPVFLIDGQVYSGPFDAILYPELPAGMGSRPRLSLHVDNSGPARQNLQLTYLAREIGWRMDYVLTMNKAATSGLLSGWVTLTNRSGKDFPGAHIELLAGEPRSAQPPFASRALFASDGLGAAKTLAAGAESEDLFEYHLYRLKQPVNLANQQSRQVQLFEAATVPVTRKLLGRANAQPSGRETDPTQQRLEAILSFRNTESLGLGLPLPKGTLRAFQQEGESSHFLGESPLGRTAVGSSAEMRLGQVFDLSVERVVTQFEKTGKNSFRAAWRLSIHNGKKQAQQIVLQEQVPGKWTVESASHKWTKPAAGLLEFVVNVPPSRDGDPLVLTYSYSTEQ